MKAFYLFNPTKAGVLAEAYRKYFKLVLDLSQPVWCDPSPRGFPPSGTIFWTDKNRREQKTEINMEFFDLYVPTGSLEDYL